MKKIVLILVAILVFTGCGSQNANNENANKENANEKNVETTQTEFEDREYIVGLDDTFAPMGFRDDNGDIVGFDVDLAKKAASIMGIDIKFQPIDWSMKETELNAKNIDFIWNGYSITDEREEKVAFSDPYLENSQIIVVMKSSDIMTKDDLAGKVVTVQAESSALEAVRADEEFMDMINGKAPIEFPTNVECFADVEAGRSDAIVVDEVLARYYMRQNEDKEYRVLDENFGYELYAVGMRKDDTFLVEKLNEALTTMKDNGDYDEIYDKWFSGE